MIVLYYTLSSNNDINFLLSISSYFVSEKSDGVRVLLYCVLGEDGKQNVYLVRTGTKECFEINWIKMHLKN